MSLWLLTAWKALGYSDEGGGINLQEEECEEGVREQVVAGRACRGDAQVSSLGSGIN